MGLYFNTHTRLGLFPVKFHVFPQVCKNVDEIIQEFN